MDSELSYDRCTSNDKKIPNMVSGYLANSLRRAIYYTSEFVPSPSSPSLDLSFLPFNAKIVASSEQGIIVFESPDPNNDKNVFYNVCKPTTKQVLRLPDPKTSDDPAEKVAIIVRDSEMSLRYKIVRLSYTNTKFTAFRQHLQHDEVSALICEIFDSEKGAWGPIYRIQLPYGVYLTNSQAIIARGHINMLLTNGDVLMFDAHDKEEWTCVPLTVPSKVPSKVTTTVPSKVPSEVPSKVPKVRKFHKAPKAPKVRKVPKVRELPELPKGPKAPDECDFAAPMQLVKYDRKLGIAWKPPNSSWEIWGFTSENNKQSFHRLHVYSLKEDGETESLVALDHDDSNTSILLDYKTLIFRTFKTCEDISKVMLSDHPYQVFNFKSDFEQVDL